MEMIKKINTKFIVLRSKAKKFFNPLLQTRDDPLFREYEIGEFTYGTPRIMKYGSTNKIKIGKFCSIAEGVKIFVGGEHKIEYISTYPFKERLKIGDIPTEFSKGDVTIENDVWIGYGAILLSGITIGNGSVIGAGAVVTKSVEPYSIIIGNPGKLIRKRFNDETIKVLNSSKWWDWKINKINKNIKLFFDNPEKNIEKIKKL